MNQPIKFRAWDKTDGKMVDLATSNLDAFGVCLFHDLCIKGKTTFKNAEEVHEYEVMQFTGLHDKNGREIYEGDVLRDAEWGMRNEGVFFNTEKGAFYAWWRYDKPKSGQRKDVFSGGYFDAERASHGEVIGNIYENPELLKV